MFWHEILGIRLPATEKEIKTAYRALARKYHPDINKTPTADERMQEINKAFAEARKYISRTTDSISKTHLDMIFAELDEIINKIYNQRAKEQVRAEEERTVAEEKQRNKFLKLLIKTARYAVRMEQSNFDSDRLKDFLKLYIQYSMTEPAASEIDNVDCELLLKDRNFLAIIKEIMKFVPSLTKKDIMNLYALYSRAQNYQSVSEDAKLLEDQLEIVQLIGTVMKIHPSITDEELLRFLQIYIQTYQHPDENASKSRKVG